LSRSGRAASTAIGPEDPLLLPLCRSEAQLEAVIDAGLGEVELDWMEMVGLARAVSRARAAGLRVSLATLRVQKPGDESFDQKLMRLAPDGLLVRHWGGLAYGVTTARSDPDGARPLLHGDFSLNVTNSLTAAWLLAHGLESLTASHDLDQNQLFGLLEHGSPERFTVVVHHRIAAFHTEHCVYAHLLSNGRDYHSCGRPCERHQIALRDVQHRDHAVIVDAACRNTVFNGVLQSSAALVPGLLRRGVRRFRVEFVREGRAEASSVLAAYRELLAGSVTPEQVLAKTGARAQQGVADRPMELRL
jgi:putative protease